MSVYPGSDGLSIHSSTDVMSVYPSSDGISIHSSTDVMSVYPSSDGISIHSSTDGMSVHSSSDEYPCILVCLVCISQYPQNVHVSVFSRLHRNPRCHETAEIFQSRKCQDLGEKMYRCYSMNEHYQSGQYKSYRSCMKKSKIDTFRVSTLEHICH